MTRKEVEDYLHAIFDYGDLVGSFDCSWSMRNYRKQYTRIDVSGDNGQMTVTDTTMEWQLQKSHGSWEAGDHSLEITDLYPPLRIFIGEPMYTLQEDDVVRTLMQRKSSNSQIEDVLRTQRMIDTVRETARKPA